MNITHMHPDKSRTEAARTPSHSLHFVLRFHPVYSELWLLYLHVWASTLNSTQSKALHIPVWINPLISLRSKNSNIKKVPHLKCHIDGSISNLVDIWQRPSVVQPSIGSQLQILGFLQLQLKAVQDETNHKMQ